MGYSILIVDDEITILNGIRDKVDWNALGIDRVETALTGEDALARFFRQPFDIMLTDIRMKAMNGLQLIREIKRTGRFTRFIVMSAYDDFAYAKEAMQMNIDNYLLKPVNWNELTDTLKNSIRKIKNEKAFGLDADVMDMLRTNTLYKWCRESLDEFQFNLRRDLFAISLDRRFYMVGVIPKKGAAYQQSGKQLAAELSDMELFETFDKNICAIFAGDTKEAILNRVSAFHERIQRLLGPDYSFILGKLVSGYKQVSTSYATVFAAQTYLGFVKDRQLVFFDDIVEASDHNTSPGSFDFLRRAVISLDREETARAVRKISEHIRAAGVGPIEAFNGCVGAILELRGIAAEMNLDIRDRYSDISIMLQTIQSLNGIEQVESFLDGEASRVITSLEVSKSSYPPIISRVIEYTRQNYTTEITLRMLGDKFHVNANYLGALFAETVGQPFSEYLNRCRMVEAKNMLLSTDLKVNSIATALGYSNPSYFYILFKKLYGVSPNEFRGAGREQPPAGDTAYSILTK